MKIVRTSRSKGSVVKRIIECSSCGCEFEVESKELHNFNLVSDWRDGDYYEVPCPETDCKHINNMDASLFS